MTMTLRQLQDVMPLLPLARAEEYHAALMQALEEFSIMSPAALAAFLAQLAHESGDLRWWEELPHRKPVAKCKLCQRTGKGHPAGAQYEGRSRTLGNTERGDGERFKGRGPIQLTGRANYRAASLALFPGTDGGGVTLLELEPERVLHPKVGFRAAAWFWATHKANGGTTGILMPLNDVAESAWSLMDDKPHLARGRFDAITRAINGGLGHADDRWRRYLRAREVLGQPRRER